MVCVAAVLWAPGGARVRADEEASPAHATSGSRLEALMHDVSFAPTAAVRRRTVALLSATSDPRAVAPLVEVVVTDASAGVRLSAVRGLGSLGGDRACAALRFAAVADESRAARRAAARVCASDACPPEHGVAVPLLVR